MGRSKETNESDVLPLSEVLKAEFYELHDPERKRTIKDDRVDSVYDAIHGLPDAEKRTALCLSGGGIRSATFCLGVLQGLADRGILEKFHYLSTVSGGGYIGSWLTAWLHRRGPLEVLDQLRPPEPGSSDPEPKEITHLRSYSNYLTPTSGLFSVDTWTLVMIYLRNLLLNWLVFMPLLVGVLLVPRMYVALIDGHFGISRLAAQIDADLVRLVWKYTIPLPTAGEALLFLGLIPAAVALAYLGAHRPSLREYSEPKVESVRGFKRWFIVPLALSAALLTLGRAWYLPRPDNSAVWKLEDFAIAGGVLFFLGWLLTYPAVLYFWPRNFKSFARKWRSRLIEFFVVVLAGGALGGALLWVISITEKELLPQNGENGGVSPLVHATLDGPVLVLVFLLTGVLIVGINSRYVDDPDREWWARSGAWVLIMIIGWSATVSLVVWGPNIFYTSNILEAINVPISMIGAVAGFVTILFGVSSRTPANARLAEKSGRLTMILDHGIKVAAPVFTFFLVVFITILTDFLIVFVQNLPAIYQEPSVLRNLRVNHRAVLEDSSFVFLLISFIVLVVVSFVMAWCININQFSLHALYRNRLVRAYLGASNPDRRKKANQFTDFAHDDNLRMSDLWPHKDPKTEKIVKRLFHVVNMTWNLVDGKKLQWQNRKATTFTVSPLHAGNHDVGYRRSHEYGGTHQADKEGRTDTRGPEQGSISLGTAFTISGAAASPNMGYYSSTFVTFLMTVFNARLGWWLGNPKKDTYKNAGPKWAFWPMINEALGRTTDHRDYIYLSDGGHFENLGLYEMVLRRAHCIFVVDASRDPDHKFENLGNAIRRIRVDLGVNIKVLGYPKKEGVPSPYCALGTIEYKRKDKGAKDGVLIYIKPGLFGDEPTDIYNYSKDNVEFPHESTGDVWFSEQQFESYRALGFYAIQQIFTPLPRPGVEKSLGQIKRDAEAYLKRSQSPPRRPKPENKI